MTNPKEILRGLENERFSEVLAASPRQFREELFRRAGIKAKKKGAKFSLTAARDTLDAKVKRFIDALRNGEDLGSDGDEALEEVIRNYLYTKRSLLADALDHFGIPHDNGLTDADLDFIEELTAEQGTALRGLLLEKKHDPADVDLYLAYMQIPTS